MAKLWQPLFAIIALVAAGCADHPRLAETAAQLSPPGNKARLFIYRDYDVAQSLAWVPIFLNGANSGGVGPGHVLVCDLSPGTYTIDPKSAGLYPDQAKTVTVAAGQDIYAKIGSFRTINPTSRNQSLMSTFVVTLEDTATGQGKVGPLWYTPCGAPYAPA
jgi:hypothetical protein